jgi:hypothetical protein
MKTFARDLRDARKPIDGVRVQIELLESQIKLRPGIPSDIAAVLDRQEMRAIVRALPLAERTAMLLNATDQRIVEAVLQMPAEMSGFPADRYAAIEKNILNRSLRPNCVRSLILGLCWPRVAPRLILRAMRCSAPPDSMTMV